MGCSESKLDGFQAVALCRDRSHYIDEVIRHRQSLVASHSAYLHSLRSLGLSLHRFFLPDCPPPSPILPLPSHRKCDDVSSSSRFPPVHFQTVSEDKEGEEFPCSDGGDDDVEDLDELLYTNLFRRSHLQPELDTVTTSTTHLDYARNGSPAVASVAYVPPPPPEVFPVQVGVVGGEHYYSHEDYYRGTIGNGGGDAMDGNGYSYPYLYPPVYGVTNNADGGTAYLGGPSTSPYASRRFTPTPSSSSRFAMVWSPPPPTTTSTWDFLNPFNSASSSCQGYNRVYTPSWSSREVREREGIPDLEEEGEEQVIVKEMYGDRKFELPVGVTSVSPASFSAARENGRRSNGELRQFPDGLSSVGGSMDHRMHGKGIMNDGDDIQLQVHMEEEERPTRKVIPESKSALDVMQEIRIQFDRASMSCKEVSKLLGSKRSSYHHRKQEVETSRMMYRITPALSKASSSKLSISRCDEQSVCSSSDYLEFDMDRRTKVANPFLTLQKLCVWEKKLHREVRAEEKMRALHDKKCKLLRRLDEKGTEAKNVDSTRDMVKNLTTKIRIAIQFIDSISNKINRLRDEELWPQISELIHGLAKMWWCLMECHRNQCQAIVEAKNLDAIVSAYTGSLSDAHMEATIQLAQELLDWIEKFCSWIQTQRNYVKTLNSWLQKCLEPEETVDGITSSPRKMGAPPIFIICNYWSQVIDGNSEKEVVEAMQAFATSILHVWQQHYYERRQMMSSNREMERKLKILEREDQKIHKSLNAVNKRYPQDLSQSDLLSHGEIVRLSHVTEANNLKLGLKRICEAMEKFASRSLKRYDKLCTHCDELSATTRQENVA